MAPRKTDRASAIQAWFRAHARTILPVAGGNGREAARAVGWRRGRRPNPSDNPRMAQGKRISADVPAPVLDAIAQMGAAARETRTRAGEGQAAGGAP
jgi:hypothetical protein